MKKDKHEQDEECSNNKYKMIQEQLCFKRFITKELCLSSKKLKCCKNWNHNKNNATKNIYLQNH